jgi:ELWxxDGT repeat protein
MNLHVLCSLLLLACAAVPAWSQAPQLVADVDPASGPAFLGDPQQLTVAGDALYAFADTPTGRGLYRVPTGGVPVLVRELPPVSPDPIRFMTANGGGVYFTAQGAFWASDGTPAGTRLVKAFPYPGAGATGAIISVGGVGYFSVVVGASTVELWKSDGSAPGTVRVATVDARELTVAGGRVYFTTGDQGLWTTDGTEAGTVRLGSIFLKDAFPKRMIAFGDALLFIAGAAAFGENELWRTDGTEAGTARVTFLGSTLPPRGLAAMGGIALVGAGPVLWSSDGTPGGTSSIQPDIVVRATHVAGATAFVHGRNVATGSELWTTDGTAAGTVLLDYCPGACSFLDFGTTAFATLAGGGVAFTRGQRGLWVSNGTVAGTTEIAVLPPGSNLGAEVHSLARVGDLVYFVAGTGLGRDGVWRTDGTAAGTVLVTMGTRGGSSSPAFGGQVGSRAIFSAIRPDLGRELWSTTGSPASTEPVDLTPGPMGSDIRPIGSLGSVFAFGVVDTGGVNALWSTDGTAAGTIALPAVPDGRRSAENGGIAVFADNVGSRIVRTDGTPAGTYDVSSPVNPLNALQLGQGDDAIVAWGSGFAATMRHVSGVFGALWLTNGAAAADAVTFGSMPVYCDWSTPVDERLFLACNNESGPARLWVSDGSHSGTRAVADLPATILPGGVALAGKLFFRLADPSGPVLWWSDGTAAGTGPFAAVAPVPADVKALTVSNDVLYFVGTTPGFGNEPWRTDGTAAGTFLLRDVEPGPASGVSWSIEADGGIAAVQGGVVFAAGPSATGAEPWGSDGSAAGTLPLPEVAPGPASSSPAGFRRVGRSLYFAASDLAHGREPWQLQLAPGAIAVDDAAVAEGDAGTTTVTFAVRLESPVVAPLVVSYATATGSAQPGEDFIPVSGTLTFAPGSLEMPVAVEVVGDLHDEADESFSLRITSAGGAPVADGRGLAVIRDDDAPLASAGPASVAEGDSGQANASFPVTLTTRDGAPSARAVVLQGDLVFGTAGEGDFPAPPETTTVSFPVGTVSGTTLALLLPVKGDTFDEANESFQVRLIAENDATVEPALAQGTILDDDGVQAAPPVEVAHGVTIHADLAPPLGRAVDADFYVMRLDGFSSYEVVVDGVSGDAAPLELDRLGSSGASVQSATVSGIGGSSSMRWGGVGDATQQLRVRSAACASGCGPDDVYRLRFYETTLAGPRLNNAGSQITVVMLHNTSASPVSAGIVLWAPDGTTHGSIQVSIDPRATAVVDTAAIYPGVTGSLTIPNDAPYGALAGKAVSFDPVSGFAFDTPLVYRKR